MSSTPSKQDTLHIKNISKSFKERSILKDVSLSVQTGEVVAILGPNGAGKTTTFYIICGLTNTESGQILINDTDITHKPIHLRAQLGVGYLPQEPSIFETLTVQQNIMGVLDYMDYTQKEKTHKLEELMEAFSISYLKNSKARMLSGGERRRLEIARSLASNPKFLLLDEPLAGVDPVSVQEIHHLIYTLKHRGIGVIITDHNVRETLKIAERSYILHNGSILTSGNADHIVNHPTVKEIYLGKDFTI